MLILDNTCFQIRNDTRDTAFFVHREENETLKIALDIGCQDNIYNDEYCNPGLVINDFETDAVELHELIGKSFSVKDIETSYDREDMFYLFEHEPFVEFNLMIVDINGYKIHVRCFGIAVTDGYAEPYVTAPFEADCWLPIINDVSDWEKFGL